MPNTVSQVVKLNYSVKETAEALGIGETLCRKLIDQGVIPARKLGDRVLVNVKDLERANDALPTIADQRTSEERAWRVS